MRNSAIGDDWEDVKREIYMPEEIAAGDLRVELICAMVDARAEKGITQKDLEALTGIRQSDISRIEKGKVSPRLDTVVKILGALGKKLVVVPM